MCRLFLFVSKLTARTNQLYIAQSGDEEAMVEVGFHAFSFSWVYVRDNLGARYLLAGGVQVAGGRVRMMVRLMDVETRSVRRCGAVPEAAWIPTHSYFFGKSSVKFTRNPQSGPPSGFSA